MAGSMEYWLVSAPGDPGPEETWRLIEEKTTSMSANSRFNLPDLKIGTMDTLMSVSDQLQKLDPFVENVVRKLAQYMADILEPEDRGKLHENLLVGSNKQSMELFLLKFQWDGAKFPLRQPLPSIVDGISKLVTQIDADYKSKSNSYNTMRSTLQTIERKSTGSLVTRSLAELVTRDHFVKKSEYMQTLLVVVPRMLYKDWNGSYESLTAMVVPRSSLLITEDQEYGLYAVTVFKKVIDEFKIKAREKKFTVRDFEYDPKAIEAERREKQQLETQIKRQFNPLMNWLKINFSQTFSAWIHLKALRVFTESILLYSLPINFQALVMKPHKKAHKKVTEALSNLFGHVDSKFIANEAEIDLAGLQQYNSQDYHPYVFFRVNLDLLDK